MEYITNLTEAIEFVKQFITIEDLIIFRSVEVSEVLSYGYVEVGHMQDDWDDYYSFKHPDGQMLNYFPGSKQIRIYDKSIYTNIYKVGNDELYYQINGLDLCGISCGIYIKVDVGGKADITCIDLRYDNISVDSVRRYTSVEKPFADSDGAVLRCQTSYNTTQGTVSIVYRDHDQLRHCIAGPAVIRGDKVEYYIRGRKMSKKQWLEERKNPTELSPHEELDDL